MADLGREIALLQKHLPSIEFAPEIKAQWLSHLFLPFSPAGFHGEAGRTFRRKVSRASCRTRLSAAARMRASLRNSRSA